MKMKDPPTGPTQPIGFPQSSQPPFQHDIRLRVSDTVLYGESSCRKHSLEFGHRGFALLTMVKERLNIRESSERDLIRRFFSGDQDNEADLTA